MHFNTPVSVGLTVGNTNNLCYNYYYYCCCLIKQYSHSHIYCTFLTKSSWDSVSVDLWSAKLVIFKLDCRKLIWPMKSNSHRSERRKQCCLQNWESNMGAEEPNKSELKKTFCICQLGVRCPFLSLELATYFWQG